MKNRVFLTRAFISTVLSISFLVLPVRLSSSIAAVPAAIKTESQYRAEASRYDAAVRAIAGILTMKLETSDDLKAALNIVEQQRQNLKLFRSKLAVIALTNSTFATAVKRKMPTKEAATTLITSLSTDRSKVNTIGGFDEVKTQIKNSADADAAVLRRASDRLKTAADRLKAAQRVESSELHFVRASFTRIDENMTGAAPQDPLTFAIAITGFAFWAVVVIGVVAYGVSVVGNANTDEGRDAVAECQVRADQNYAQCVAASTDLFGKVGCAAILLAEQALCLGFPDQVK